jgi:putative ABC transport system permease protein
MLDHWQEVFQTLRRNRLRTFLTACGVFWGVFMLVVMLGAARGLENGATGGFGTFALNTVFVWGDETSKPYAGYQAGRRLQFTVDDAEAVRGVPGVEVVSPRNMMRGRWGGASAVRRKDKAESFGMWGVDHDFNRLETLDIEAGRFIDPDDVRQARKVAVIGSRVREVMFDPSENPIGGTLQVGASEITVVGVYRSPLAGRQGEWANSRMFLPRTVFSRMNGRSPHLIDDLAILVAANESAVDVEADVKSLLRRRLKVHPDDRSAPGSFNRAANFAKVRRLFWGIAALTWVVGTLTLLAGAIGVSNIMMIAVAERTREIGIRKAIGATPASITAQILTEATVLTGLSGYLGLVAGIGVVELAGKILARIPVGKGPSFFGRPEVDLSVAVTAALVLTAAGALAGLAPARSAVAVRPVEALAHE